MAGGRLPVSGIPVAIRRDGDDVLGMARASRVLPNGRSEFNRFDPFDALNSTDKRAVLAWAKVHRPDLLLIRARRLK